MSNDTVTSTHRPAPPPDVLRGILARKRAEVARGLLVLHLSGECLIAGNAGRRRGHAEAATSSRQPLFRSMAMQR